MRTGDFWLGHLTDDGNLLVRLSGELDMAGAEQVRTFVETTLTRPYRSVRFDCREVSFIDSVGVKSLFHLVRRCSELGIEPVFTLGPRIQRVLDAMGVGSMSDLAERLHARPA